MKNLNLFLEKRRLRCVVGTAVAFTSVAGSAYASGLQSANSALTSFNTWLYSFLGIAAITYLTYEGVKCWAGQHNWVTDFGKACLLVVVVGAVASVLAPYLWSLLA